MVKIHTSVKKVSRKAFLSFEDRKKTREEREIWERKTNQSLRRLPSAPPSPTRPYPGLHWHCLVLSKDMGDGEILKYRDVVLRSSDLDTLRDSCFLNDQIITFYLSYLFSFRETDDILFVQPSISLCLANCESDKFVEEFAESCKLSSKKLVLFVVNDNDDFSGGDSGNHWSILVYERSKNSFQHYDSMEGVNNFHAIKLYDAVKEHVGPGGDVSRQSSKHKKKKKPKSSVAATPAPAGLPTFVEGKVPQQSNGYDCGLYVLAIARAISQCEYNNSDVLSAIQKHVDDSIEVKMRSELLELIRELQEH